MRNGGAGLDRPDVAGERRATDQAGEITLLESSVCAKPRHTLHEQARGVFVASYSELQARLNPGPIHSEHDISRLNLIPRQARASVRWPALSAIPPESTLAHVVSTKQSNVITALSEVGALERKSGQQLDVISELSADPSVRPLRPHIPPAQARS